MSQAEDAKPGSLPMIGGLLLLLLSASLAGVAWVGYERGVPGVPNKPPEQAGGVVLYAPPDVEFDTLISYSQKGSPYSPLPPLAADSILIEIRFTTTHRSPFVIVAGFRGDARLTQSSFPGEKAFDIDEATIGRYDDRLFWPLNSQRALSGEGENAPGPATIRYTYDVAKEPVTAGNTMVITGGALAHPVFSSDNARTAIRTKRLHQVARCPALSDPAAATSFSREQWLNAGLPTCRSDYGLTDADQRHNRRQKTTINVVPAFSNPRLDFATRPVSGDAVLGWQFPGDETARVNASLTDLDEEARGQSYLFASGVAVGLATSLFPSSVKIIYDQLNQRRRWRRQQARQDPLPDETM
ncbi:hypothetical protein Aph01nite_81320 [Acrocarpospora phusangensis]|uniref:Uncharacterized protein n=1 Tax=Acrocarpospora phusangensis TaxID=1070424 RepID=A0A919UT13_9ACTN|nr:hypothetical protein [Acrocarpospora phusangensis]GIH29822.1 hypothetical protein Aph01nite_81320 [Acrocarpospora phusangensis]